MSRKYGREKWQTDSRHSRTKSSNERLTPVALKGRTQRRSVVALVTMGLVCASIVPSGAIACEGASLEWEGKEKAPLFQVSKANGFKTGVTNTGPNEAKKLTVSYVGEFEDNASPCNGLAKLAVNAKCEVRIKCKATAKIGDKGEVSVKGENFADLDAKLECIA